MSLVVGSDAAVTGVADARLAGFDSDGLVDDLGVLDGCGLAARLQDLERLQRRVEHAIVAVVGEADRRAVWAVDGHRSVRGWCQATVNWSGAETTHRIRTVRLFADLDQLADALAAGTVGVAQVRELARARANPRCGDQLAGCADILLQHARQLCFDEFRLVVVRWETLADADGAHHDHEQTHAARRASIEPVGNGFHLDADCGAAQGVAMCEILDRFCDAEFHADCDHARQRLSGDVTAADLDRTPAQRRMDALHAIFMAAAATPPGSKPPEPVVNIVVDQTTFEATLTAMATGTSVDEWMPSVTDPTRRRCETLDGDLIDPVDAVIAALTGQIRRVVFNTASCVIDLGVTSRLFRGTSRLAVWLQGTRCLWPGCGRHHCQIDHTTPWANHGPTNPHNAGPACAHHNLWKTRGYHTTRDPDGHWHTHRPDGTEIKPI
jgi:uncharacterized protein DUF222